MKASVTENLGEGLYRAEIVYDTDRLDAEIEALNDQRIANVQKLLDAQVAVIEKQQKVDELADFVDALIRSGVARQ